LAFKVEPFSIGSSQVAFHFKIFLMSWMFMVHLCSLFGKDDKQYGTNFWEGETFSYPLKTKAF
jgi:hypothetical protein